MGYRTMPNFGRIIKGMNKKVMDRYVTELNIKKMKDWNKWRKIRADLNSILKRYAIMTETTLDH